MGLLLLLVVAVCAQDFCGERCDSDRNCAGSCNKCLAGPDRVRVCVATSACGGECRTAADCASSCNMCDKTTTTCVSATMSLPCAAPCASDAACGDECDVCRASAAASNSNTTSQANNTTAATVCVSVCGAPCSDAIDCGGKCSECVDRVCSQDARPRFTAGEVVGIAFGGGLGVGVAVGLLGLLITAIVGCYAYDDDDPDGNDHLGSAIGFMMILSFKAGLIFVPVGVIVVGLALGLSPSICCA
jgi:hypothetical protein